VHNFRNHPSAAHLLGDSLWHPDATANGAALLTARIVATGIITGDVAVGVTTIVTAVRVIHAAAGTRIETETTEHSTNSAQASCPAATLAANGTRHGDRLSLPFTTLNLNTLGFRHRTEHGAADIAVAGVGDSLVRGAANIFVGRAVVRNSHGVATVAVASVVHGTANGVVHVTVAGVVARLANRAADFTVAGVVDRTTHVVAHVAVARLIARLANRLADVTVAGVVHSA
jgi:hypothetical protein